MAALILGAREMRQLSNSVIFVVTFLSNFHFLDKIDYFDPSANLKPLLHTWSLAVEEQF